MLKEFRDFAMRGSVLDMAIGIIIGLAFGAIVQSAVADIIMPPIGMLLGKVDFTNLFVVLREGGGSAPYATLTEAQEAGAVTLNYGVFVNQIVSFIIVAFVVFAIVRQVNKMKREAPAEVTTRECPFCFSTVSLKATRCAHCTSELEPV